MGLIDRVISLTLPAVPKPVVRFFSRRYIAGPSFDDAFVAARQIGEQGAVSTLDILGEFTSCEKEANQNAQAYVDLVGRIRDERLQGVNVSVKLTALGLQVDAGLCLRNMERLVEEADRADNFVRIDMEDASCTTATLDVYRSLRSRFPERVGVVVQSRLRRTVQDIEALTVEPANFRICKGIYLEPRRIAYTDAELIRRNFVLAVERMLDRGAYVGIATHDELLVWESLRLVRKYGLARDQYEFQMLLGVDEPLRRILIEEGHRVRVYVPFGEHWYPYSVRRLRENPQIAGYAFKALFQKESA